MFDNYVKIKRDAYGAVFFFALVAVIVIVGVVGYIANLAQLVMISNTLTFATLTLAIVIKIVGLFVFPIGSIMGWIGFFV